MDDIQQLRAQCLMQALNLSHGDIETALEITVKMVDYILSGKSDEKRS